MIILYREGLSDVQAKHQLSASEIPALKNMIDKIGKSTKCENYNPEVIIVLANKKISTRIFQCDEKNTNNCVLDARNNPHPSIKNT